MSSCDRSARRRDAYAKRKQERERSSLRRAASQSGMPSQEAIRSRNRRILGKMPEVRKSADRSRQKTKCDYRKNVDRGPSKLISERRARVARRAADNRSDYRGCVDQVMEDCAVTRAFELNACTFGPNDVGSDCFFRCIETATGHSVHSQRVLLSLAATEGDLELYRFLLGCPEEDLAAAIALNAGEERVSDISTHRARVVRSEMEFCREVADLAGLRSAVLGRNFWADPIAVSRIQLSLKVKVIALSNLGGGQYEIIEGELPNGVADFAPDSYVVMRYDGSHYDLLTDGLGANSFLYAELPVEIRSRLGRREFVDAVRDAPSTEPPRAPTPMYNEFAVSPVREDPQNPMLLDAAEPTPINLDGAGNGIAVVTSGEDVAAMYLTDYAFAWNSGGGDCFFLCLEQATGHSAYSQRLLLSASMKATDLELYRSILSHCDAEVAAADDDQANGVPISATDMMRTRIILQEMEFCRGVDDVVSLRAAVLTKNYWADQIAIERLQLALNVKVVVIRPNAGGIYEIQYDMLPEGVVNFAPDAFVVVRYNGSHYELLEGPGGRRTFQYEELPCPIRGRLRGIGFFAAIASVPRNMDASHLIAPPPPVQNAPIHPPSNANRAAKRRLNAKMENPARMAARRPESELPEVHSVGEMGIPCAYCGALRWPVEATRKSMCCSRGRVRLPDIPEAPEPLRSLLDGSDADSADFNRHVRMYNSLLSFASVGSHCDIPTMNRPGSYVYRIHGSMYHTIGTVENKEGEGPKFAQIYLFDTEAATSAREALTNPPMRRATLSGLHDMMVQYNPLARVFFDCAARMRTSGMGEMRMVIRTDDDRLDSRTYNAPSAPEIAAIISEESAGKQRDIRLSLREGGFSSISDNHQCYDPLAYALIHPRGEPGWSLGVPHATGAKNVSPSEFAAYRLMIRAESPNHLHQFGRLFHQYVCDQWSKVETQRLLYARYHQEALRAASYRQVQCPPQGATTGRNLGCRVILPATFSGGPRHMMELYQDAMAVVRTHGKPHLFIMFTCNPSWPEIRAALLPNQSADMRPDITARVFRLKLDALLKDLAVNSVLGDVVARLYVVEFQKRGLPHAHILCILSNEHAPRSTDDYDAIVRACIPDPEKEPALWHTVTTSMMHGPCGALNPNASCMEGGLCTKGYPKRFIDATVEIQGFPEYKRPEDGRTVLKKGVHMTNQWVVPYNPWLACKYNAHINVEVCSTVSAVKYLYKYVYKGPDRAAVEIGNDEIAQYLDARYFSAQEACWRILGFELHGRCPAVIRLHVHLEDEQSVVFRDEELIGDIASRPSRKTKLTEWFVANSEYPQLARGVKYHDFPRHFTWDINASRWNPRKRHHDTVIGRMYSASPLEGERFYLRLLLTAVSGCTSYECLRKSPDGTTCETFREAASARGLLREEKEYFLAFHEAASHATPRALSRLFASILAYCSPGCPRAMWDSFYPHLEEAGAPDAYAIAVVHLDEDLRAAGSSLESFPTLPQIAQLQTRILTSAGVPEFEPAPQREFAEANVPKLNEEQKAAFDIITADVYSGKQSTHFIDGPGGSGKTFLYNALLAAVRGRGIGAAAVASSGIAALLLRGGRTAHSKLKLPIRVSGESICAVQKGSEAAEYLSGISLIIWDEAPMAHRHLAECLDRSLRDIRDDDRPFGGVVVVFGGDFRQIPPIVRHGSRANVAAASLKRSPIWRTIRKHTLTRNLRLLEGEEEFSGYLIRIGDGLVDIVDGEDTIELPREICTDSSKIGDAFDAVGKKVFPEIETRYRDEDYLLSGAVLAARNADVDGVNDAIFRRFPGDEFELKSVDSVAKEGEDGLYPVEFLNSLDISGLPPHTLRLKVGMPVMLLRNLNPAHGMCNGSKAIVRRIHPACVEVEVRTGKSTGSREFIPRLPLQPSDADLPFTLVRYQFPLRPCFAISMNKSQGQTLMRVGIYLPQSVFSHGQLYVALSRARRKSDIHIVLPFTSDRPTTRNVVYKELLA